MTIFSISRDSKEEICEYLKKVHKLVNKIEDSLEDAVLDTRDSREYRDYSERGRR